jgi:hypothetical protein
MDASEPRVRRRGFFLHSDTTGEAETGDHENPEGLTIRARLSRPTAPRHTAHGMTSGRSAIAFSSDEVTIPEIRSGSVTGSRQRAHLPR